MRHATVRQLTFEPQHTLHPSRSDSPPVVSRSVLCRSAAPPKIVVKSVPKCPVSRAESVAGDRFPERDGKKPFWRRVDLESPSCELVRRSDDVRRVTFREWQFWRVEVKWQFVTEGECEGECCLGGSCSDGSKRQVGDVLIVFLVFKVMVRTVWGKNRNARVFSFYVCLVKAYKKAHLCVTIEAMHGKASYLLRNTFSQHS